MLAVVTLLLWAVFFMKNMVSFFFFLYLATTLLNTDRFIKLINEPMMPRVFNFLLILGFYIHSH